MMVTMITYRPACVSPPYDTARNCMEKEEYLDDCEEWDSNCLFDLKITTDIDSRKKRTCKQCEPGMICDKHSVLSQRNILRRVGWYYLDPSFTVYMLKKDTADDHKYFDEEKNESYIRYWNKANNIADSSLIKGRYLTNTRNFSSLPCPIKSRCCGSRIPYKEDVSTQDGIEEKWKVDDEEIKCKEMNYGLVFGTEAVPLDPNPKNITGNVSTFDRIKYSYWNITCAKGVDPNFPFCAVCKIKHESTGAQKRCEPCNNDDIWIRIGVTLGALLLLVLILLCIKSCKCYKKLGHSYNFKGATGDISRMIRLLIDFFQIVLSMEQLMPKVDWPASFLNHVNGLVFFDLNIMDIFGVSCSDIIDSQPDFINSMYIYFAIPLVALLYTLVSLTIHSKLITIKLDYAKNQNKLDALWNNAVHDMFEYLLEPNERSKKDKNAPTHVVSQHGLAELLKTSTVGSRIWSDSEKEAERMINDFSKNHGYLTKEEFCTAFNQVMEERQKKTSKNKTMKDALVHQKYKLIQWTYWHQIRSSILERTFVLLLIAHAPICKVAFRLFRCQNVGDRTYLMADYGVNCGVVRYDIAWGIALFYIIVYTIGFPLTLGYVLYKSRKVLYTFRVKMQLGWFYLHYNKGLEFWTLWEMILKIFLMGFLGSISPEETRPYIAALISTGAAVLITKCNPLKSGIVMHLATIKWFATALLYLSATQLIKDNGFQATGVMVILMIAVDLCFVAGIGLIFYRLWVVLKNPNMHKIKLRRASKSVIQASRIMAFSAPSLARKATAVVPFDGQKKDDTKKKEDELKFEINNWTLNTDKNTEETTKSVDESKTNGNTLTTSPEITNTSNRQPRQIGNGWWESYDPASGHMFYSHTEGITQWEWPKEVPKASRTKTFQKTQEVEL